MADTKVSAAADPGTLVATDKVPLARSASTTAYAATVAEIASYANGAYAPVYAATSPLMDGAAAAGTAAAASRGDHVHPTNTALLSRSGGTMTGALVLAADPAAPMQAATRQYVDGSAPAGGPYVSIANMHDGGRNLLHNALFNVAQRGAGAFTAQGLTLDRWRTWISADTVSVTQFTFLDATRTQIGDEEATYGLVNVFTGNAGAGSYHWLTQAIENVRRLAGKTVTISFWAAANTGTPKIGINISQNFGTGGSPSTSVRALSTGNAVTLSTTWARYSTTIAIPSIAGKTLGTNGDHSTQPELWFSCGATNNAIAGNIGVQSGTIQLWGVQLEVGSVATPLEKLDPRMELSNCQRFYTTGYFNLSGNAPSGGIGWIIPQQLPVTMRATPTMATLTPTGVNVSGQTVAGAAPASFYISAPPVATGGFAYYGTYTASADL